MRPEGISAELWEKIDKVARSLGGMAAVDGSCRICLLGKYHYSSREPEEIRLKFAPLGFTVEYSGFDDVYSIYDLITLPEKNTCQHIVAYADEKDVILCPVCECINLRSENERLKQQCNDYGLTQQPLKNEEISGGKSMHNDESTKEFDDMKLRKDILMVREWCNNFGKALHPCPAMLRVCDAADLPERNLEQGKSKNKTNIIDTRKLQIACESLAVEVQKMSIERDGLVELVCGDQKYANYEPDSDIGKAVERAKAKDAELKRLRSENIQRNRHLKRLSTWCRQDATCPIPAPVKQWVLNEIEAALGSDWIDCGWTPVAISLQERKDALHASAPEGCKCADCQIDGEACPTCYVAWWTKRHPNVVMPNPKKCDTCGNTITEGGHATVYDEGGTTKIGKQYCDKCWLELGTKLEKEGHDAFLHLKKHFSPTSDGHFSDCPPDCHIDHKSTIRTQL
jgi:hypothetical protein